MSNARRIDVEACIDAAPVGAFQLTVLGLCGLIGLVEGFDSQTVAYVAPLVMSAWKIPAQEFGVVFSSSLLGAIVGAVVFGFLGDRWGRRRSILVALLIVGVSTLAAARSGSILELIAYRFLTGIGLGGTVPNATTLISEYAPKRVRATFVTLMWAGYPLGAAVGGLLAAWLIKVYDWRSVLIAGGVMTLLVLPLAMLWLPESIQYLAKLRGKGTQLAAILRRLDRSYEPQPGDTFAVREAATAVAPVKALFMEERARQTAMLWVMFGLNVLLLFFMITWLPAILNSTGLDLSKAIGATSAFGIGGILGSIVLGRLVDSLGASRVMLPTYLICAAVLALIGYAGSESAWVVIALAFLAGHFVAGPYHVLQAVTAQFYPPAIRATGLGWAVGIGRCGSIIGTLLGGVMLSRGWSILQIFTALIVPALVCGVAAQAFHRRQALSRVAPQA